MAPLCPPPVTAATAVTFTSRVDRPRTAAKGRYTPFPRAAEQDAVTRIATGPPFGLALNALWAASQYPHWVPSVGGAPEPLETGVLAELYCGPLASA